MQEEKLLEIWEMVKGLLCESLSNAAMYTWFRDAELKAISEKDHLAVLSIPSKLRSTYVSENLKDQIEEYLSAILGEKYTLAVTSEEASKHPAVLLTGGETVGNEAWQSYQQAQTAVATPAEPPVQIASTLLANTEYDFESFVIGNSNSFACAVCKAVADNPAPTFRENQDASLKYYNPLFIYGPSGVGKTHLLYAVAKKIHQQYPSYSIVYVKGDDFTNEMVESIARKSTADFREKYRHAQVLLIDDVQFIAGKEATQLEFFHTFNELYEAKCQIILTCDCAPKDIQGLDDRLRTRFEWGLPVDIQPPDIDLRLAILRKKCDMCGISPSIDILQLLADKLRNNIRQLEGAIKKIAARHHLTGEAITMDMVLANVTDFVGTDEPETVSVDRIISLVAQKYNVPVMELRGKKRTKDIAMARHVAVYLIRQITDMPYEQIGVEFEKDHTTMMASDKVVQKRIESEPLFAIEIKDLIRELS